MRAFRALLLLSLRLVPLVLVLLLADSEPPGLPALLTPSSELLSTLLPPWLLLAARAASSCPAAAAASSCSGSGVGSSWMSPSLLLHNSMTTFSGSTVCRARGGGGT